MRFADDSTSSIGALNQRSALLRISSLPTSSTRIDGISVMPEQHGHELGAEARERQRAPPLDDQLDDVARQHEHQRDQHRQVGDRQRVEHDLGEEVGREAGGAAGERDERDERADQQGDAGQQQRGLSRNGLRP